MWVEVERRPADDADGSAADATPARRPDRDRPADASGAEPATPVPSPAAVERPGGDWERAAPEAAGLDPELVAAGVAAIGGQPGVRTVLVVHDGKIVAEESFRGAGPAAPHNVKSAAKSILSALVGIAIEEGVFTGIDQPLSELLPGALPSGTDGRERGRITLRHLLTQTTGLESTSGEHYGRWVSSPNWVDAALARPLLDPPGRTFRYSTGNTHLLSAALARAAGTSTLDFARRHLLDPLGVEVAAWSTDPQGIHLGGNETSLSPRDLARFGWLVLRGGRWGDRQLVPADWVRASTTRQVATTPEWADRYGAYGYLWWIPPDRPGDAMAVGYGGQVLYLAPAERMAIVVTATHEGKGAAWDRELLTAARDTLLAAGRLEPAM